MPGPIEADLTSARKADLRDRAPQRFHHFCAIDSLCLQSCHLSLQVIAHQVELMSIVFLGGVEGRLGRG